MGAAPECEQDHAEGAPQEVEVPVHHVSMGYPICGQMERRAEQDPEDARPRHRTGRGTARNVHRGDHLAVVGQTFDGGPGYDSCRYVADAREEMD